MTDRLYYDDPYLLSFDAVVTDSVYENGITKLHLDKSAFYPTSGGQPFDKGTVNGYEILDVDVVDGDVLHTVAGELQPGTMVHCEIDPVRRKDHMQQHCGEHMLAFMMHKRYNGYTHGLHIGEEFSTIDVTMPDGSVHLSEQEIVDLEECLNEWIMKDEEVHCFFPDEEELEKLPLRKESSVKEHIRIVHIAPDEYCACGGTHPYRTGEVGCIRILETRPSRGKMRIAFVCGMRAVRDNRKKTDTLLEAAKRLSTSWQDLPETVEKMNAAITELSQQLRQYKKQMAVVQLNALKNTAIQASDGRKVVAGEVSGLDAVTLREAAGVIAEEIGGYVLAASGNLLAFVRASDASGCNMGKVLSKAAAAGEGKGGGRPDFAQGSAGDIQMALVTAVDLMVNGGE